MRVYVQCDSCEQCRKKISRENTTVSFLQKVHIVYYILLQYPYVSSFPYKQRGRGAGGWGVKWQESSTQHRTESNDEGQSNCDWVSSNCAEVNNEAPTQYCTQVIIQIYTDSGVMYKNENGRNLRHYARVFSISRLHLSSKKLADNTKGHLKFFKTISQRERKKKKFV